jgi:hypothetical protein
MKTPPPIRRDQIWMASAARAHSHTRVRLLRVLAVTTDEIVLTSFSDRSLEQVQTVGRGARRTIRVKRMRFREHYRLYYDVPEEDS